MKATLMRLGARVKALREEKGLKRSQLAAAIGLSENSVYSIEGGRFAPSFPSLTAIAHVFCVNELDLFVAPGLGVRYDLIELTRKAAAEDVRAALEFLAQRLGVPAQDASASHPRK